MKAYIVECIGTFFLVLVIALTGNPIAIGAILAAMIYMGGYISGGHYNPAVSLAVRVRGKLSTNDFLIYTIFQVAGAIAAAYTYMFIQESFFHPAPTADASSAAIFLVEMLFTFALASVVLHTTTATKTKGNQYYGLAIGLTLMAAVYAGVTITGGVYNPAVALGAVLADLTYFTSDINSLLLYLVAQFTGGLLAGIVFYILNRK